MNSTLPPHARKESSSVCQELVILWRIFATTYAPLRTVHWQGRTWVKRTKKKLLTINSDSNFMACVRFMH